MYLYEIIECIKPLITRLADLERIFYACLLISLCRSDGGGVPRSAGLLSSQHGTAWISCRALPRPATHCEKSSLLNKND